MTIAVALMLSTLLVWTPHARAQEEIIEVITHAGEVRGYLTNFGYHLRADSDHAIRLLMNAEKMAAQVVAEGKTPSIRNVVQAYKTARSVGASTSGAAVASVTATATAIKGGATLAANGVLGVVTAPALTAGAAFTGAVAAGIGVGYGAVKAGMWSWAPCDHWITTGSPDCAEDPVPLTVLEGGWTTGPLMVNTGWDPPYSDGAGGTTVANYVYDGNQLDGTTGERASGDLVWGDGMDSGWTRTVARYCDDGGTYNFQGSESIGSSAHLTHYPFAITCPEGQVPFLEFRWSTGGTVDDNFYAASITFTQVPLDGEAAKDRTITTRATCLDPATGNTSAVSATSDAYAPGDEPLSPAVACPSGYPIVQDATVTRHVDGAPEQDQVVADYVAPDELTTVDPGDPLSVCRTSGDCELMVHKGPIDPATRCDRDDVVCLGWWHQMVEGTTDQYVCSWGGTAVTWTDCEPLANIDNPDAPQPGDGEAGEPIAPGDLPGSADNPVHLEDGCGLGFGDFINPLSGLAKGVGCALEWAFVPTTTSLNTSVVEPLQTAWNATPPGLAINTTFDFIGGLTWSGTPTCSGMLLDLTPDALRDDGYNPAGGYPDLSTGFPTRIGIPCDPPFDWTIPYAVMSSVIALGGILGAYNMIAKTIGAPSEGSSVEFRETGW